MQAPKLNKKVAESNPLKVDPSEKGRRAFVRYPVVLGATLIAPDGRKIQCEMKDFCMGGMLLHYSPQAAQEQLHFFEVKNRFMVQTTVPMPDGDKLLQFQARIVRAMQNGVGLAFVSPERDALLTMQQFALQFSSANPRPNELELGSNRGNPFGRQRSDILAGCGRVVLATMDSLLEQLGDRLYQRLFDLSSNSVGAEEQNVYFIAAEDIKVNQNKFLDIVHSSFKERLQAAHEKTYDAKETEGQCIANLSFENLSLIGDEDLGTWLAISDVTGKVEDKYKETLVMLEERLSVLFNARISHANNPYGPALFAEPFQAGLSYFRFKEVVNTACYAVFKDILINLLSDLYAKLNAILIEYGILPDLDYRMLGRSALSKHAAAPQTLAVKPGVAANPQSEMPAPTSISPMEAASTDGQAAPQSGMSVPTPVPSPISSTAAVSAGERAVPQNLFQVVQDLRALRHGLARQRLDLLPGPRESLPGMTELTEITPEITDISKCYATSDLVAAIADLQTATQSFQYGKDQPGNLKSRIVAVLLSRTGKGNVKQLNPRDSNVLEVTGDLLGAMQTDPLVAESVKPWLRQLELPVIKMALSDPTLFFNHSHVARQVVNNIAQLEFYHHGNGNSKQNAISAAIEELLEKVAKESTDGAKIFEEILSKLTKLINVQNKAYEENVRDLAKECEASPPEPETFEDNGEDNTGISAAEKHKWLLHVRRLREGDSVLQTLSGGSPQRLRVGWVNDQKSIYVFVNLKGIKETVLKAADVAVMMRLSIMKPQDNVADPAMDRAQYVIMQDLYQQVLHESTHDGVTGLINRREFDRQMREAVTSAKRDDARHVLLFIDIDKFSVINNSCGYAGGDQLLQNLVKIIQDNLPSNADIARLGSDQFGILLKDCSLDDALAFAEQKIEGIAEHKMEWKGDAYSVTLSMGLAPISSRSGDVDELLQAAESSCSIAKDNGGNRLQVFHAGHSRVAHQAEVMKWIGKIDTMLEEGALDIRCQCIQPLANDGEGQPHFEILLGVRDEHGKIGSPNEFIKAAEWYRRMSAVDRYVIKRTLSWIESNPDVMDKIDGFSINLSGQSINEEGFVDYILENLKTVSVPRDKICFEVTETVGVSSLSDATLFIERIKEEGCRFALDDFGSGMSSYGYLKNLPVDSVKIDGAFVKNMIAGSSDYAVVKSITEIAHFMKKKVVAEFVENAAVLELLREIGVDYVQGYMIDRPDSINRLLNRDFIH